MAPNLSADVKVASIGVGKELVNLTAPPCHWPIPRGCGRQGRGRSFRGRRTSLVVFVLVLVELALAIFYVCTGGIAKF